MAYPLPGETIEIFYDTDRIPVFRQGTFKADGSFWATVIQSQQTRQSIDDGRFRDGGNHIIGLMIPDRSVTPFRGRLDENYNWALPSMVLLKNSIQGFVLEELVDQPNQSLLITIRSFFGAS